MFSALDECVRSVNLKTIRLERVITKEVYMMFRQPVTKEQLQRNFPAIFAESTKESLSEKYLYIPTFKLIDGLEKQGFQIVGAKQQGSRSVSTKEHAKHVVYMTHESMKVNSLTKVGEELPMLALTNSHNGLSSFAIDTAFFRLACSNGLLMPSSTFSSARIVHKKGMENDVIEASYKVIKSFPEQIAQIEAMKGVTLQTEERLLLASSAVNLAFEPEVIELNKSVNNSIESRLLRARRSADDKSDLWTTFNVIQENVIKGGYRLVRQNEQGQRSISRQRAVNSIDRDAKLNRELMTLAQKMLEIKTGVSA